MSPVKCVDFKESLTIEQEETLRAACERIAASDGFKKSTQLVRFLRFGLETELAGDGDQLKESTIGMEVFGFPAGFDPAVKTDVRGAAGRIRKKLKEYYAGSGIDDPVRIDMPAPGYRLTFRVGEGGSPQTSTGSSPTDSLPEEKTATPASRGALRSSSPYLGPAPFTEAQTLDFFGREREIEELIEALVDDPEHRIVFLYSPSGAGKTSLINTGLRAGLESRNYEVLPAARVGIPIEGVPSELNRYTVAAIASMSTVADSTGPRIADWNEYLCARVPEDKQGLVLIVDQLEEIVKPGPRKQKLDFFLQLREALEQNRRLHVLLSFREEFREEISRLAMDLVKISNPYKLDLLTQEAAKEAILLPANRRGISFDPKVVNALIEELARDRYFDDEGRLCMEPGDYIDPLHLQVVCEALWNALKRDLPERVQNIGWSEIHLLKAASAAGDPREYAGNPIAAFVGSALENFCESRIQEVARREAITAESIDLGFRQFISDRGARLIVHQGAENTGELPTRVVKALAEVHLLRIVERNAEHLYELAHDRLIEPILERVKLARQRQQVSSFPKVALIVFACVMATIVSVAITMTVRAGLAYNRWTLTQSPDVGFCAGWFQGVVGALIWSIYVAVGLSRSWFFVGRSHNVRHPVTRAAFVGLAYGVIGAVAVTIALLWAERPDSLYSSLWISARDASRQTAFSVTGFGWEMFFFGAGVGSGSGAMAMRILRRGEWETLIKTHPRPRNWVEAGRVVRTIGRLMVRDSWVLFVPMIGCAVLFGSLVNFYRSHIPQPQLLDPKNLEFVLHSASLFARIAGDCIDISCGGLGLVAGLLYGLYLLRKGVEVSDEQLLVEAVPYSQK